MMVQKKPKKHYSSTIVRLNAVLNLTSTVLFIVVYTAI